MDFDLATRILAALETHGVHDAVFLTRLGDAYECADLQIERVALDDVMVSVLPPAEIRAFGAVLSEMLTG